jgi:hypothetical protein
MTVLKRTFTTRRGRWCRPVTSTIEQLRNGMIASVSGWGIDGAPTGIRTALALLPQAKAVRFGKR